MRQLRFFGREGELAAVRARFAEGRPLVTIVGPPGAGKTRLAHRLAECEPDVAIVDGIEYDLELARDRVGALPRARTLVTSRSRLRLEGESVVVLSGLDRESAVELFEDRARLLQFDFELTPTIRPLVERIVDRLDRLPAAIELAASRIGVLRPADLLARLEPCVLDLVSTNDAAWSAIPPWARAALMRLATVEGSMSLDVAERTIGHGDHDDAPPPLDVLAFLCDASLVVSEGGRGRTATRLRLLAQTRRDVLRRAEAKVVRTGLRLVSSAPTTPLPPAVDPGPRLVERDAAWCLLPNGDRIDLSTRAHLRRLLARLAQAREERPGTSVASAELLRCGWPGERMTREAGLHRVHVAVAALRKMGLGALLVRDREGYRLAADVDLRGQRGFVATFS